LAPLDAPHFQVGIHMGFDGWTDECFFIHRILGLGLGLGLTN
jgi:hypothetical protein